MDAREVEIRGWLETVRVELVGMGMVALGVVRNWEAVVEQGIRLGMELEKEGTARPTEPTTVGHEKAPKTPAPVRAQKRLERASGLTP